MKKISILTILTAVTLMISSMTVAQAGTVGLRSTDLLQGSEDLKEMKSLLPDMQQWIADADLPDTKITEADLNNGYKVYTDFKLENSKDSSSESIQDSLEENPYIWEIPVKISDKTYTFTVGRSQPLSENGKQNLTAAEQKEIKEKEGKFCVISFGEGEDLRTLAKSIKAGYDYSDVYIVGGIPGQPDEYIMGVTREGANFTALSQMPKGADVLTANDMKQITPISWDTMLANEKAAIEQNRSHKEVRSGGFGSSVATAAFPTSAVLVSALLMLGILGAAFARRYMH